MNRRTQQLKKRLAKKTKKGFRGYPLGTIAFYGRDDKTACKVVASIIGYDGAEAEPLRKWFDDAADIRSSQEVLEEMTTFLEDNGVVSVAMMDRIIGCPHEEGIDYEGPVCPHCPFWANRDRWTGETVQ